MAPNPPAAAPNHAKSNNKRKEPPTQPSRKDNGSSKRPKTDHRAKTRDARTLATQTKSAAFQNGELDVDKFVKARKFEIQALEEGMHRSKKAMNRRAFQQVPKELRRRTASHNVKRVPKRLRKRGEREMAEDNTPTVTARRRKPTRHMRLRLETAKKLRDIAKKRKGSGAKKKGDEVTVKDVGGTTEGSEQTKTSRPSASKTVTTRAPKVKKATLATPAVPKAKFRKRQKHKAWLPTHLYHAKRARMTPPSAPLWRFSIPLTPTAKCYRPTHRASQDRGAIAWDTSYVSTIGLEGPEKSLLSMLRALGVEDNELTGRAGAKWRSGTRALETLLRQRESPHELIAPVTILWCASPQHPGNGASKPNRSLFLRVHPSAFFQLWEEVVRLSKVAKPEVRVEDLRFEIGSIRVTGPGATEALLSALWPSPQLSSTAQAAEPTSDAMEIDGERTDAAASTSVADVWKSLAGVTSTAVLPLNCTLGFDVQDPRLHHPPRTIKLPKSLDEHEALLQLLASWPVDSSQDTQGIYSRQRRLAAGRALPSQKAINRRKGNARPGEYPAVLEKDPRIPVLLYTTASENESGRNSNGAWTLLAPWKTIQPIWYSLMYYHLSTGQQPRLGCLEELRQLAFEQCSPWFPADFPGTKAGCEWEVQERAKRHDEWKRRPKGKRTSWEAVDVGAKDKGEIGVGWSCDWERLISKKSPVDDNSNVHTNTADSTKMATDEVLKPTAAKPPALTQLTASQARSFLRTDATPDALPTNTGVPLITVSLRLVTRGVPKTCARIYRLPSASQNPQLRQAWLTLLSASKLKQRTKGEKHALPRLPPDAPQHEVHKRLARSLLEPVQAGNETYPACPGEQDLIGFVTTGNFNLAEGHGIGIGSVRVDRVSEEVKAGGEAALLCVVRNNGDSVARLAKWRVC